MASSSRSKLGLMSGILMFQLVLGMCAERVFAQEGNHNIYLPHIQSTAPGPSKLVGDPLMPATEAIPRIPFIFRAEDYSDDHPQLGGLMVSFNTIFLVFTLDTTVAEANAILAELGAEIVGGIPGDANQVGGILLLRLPTTTQEAMIAVIDSLRTNPKVEIAVQDSLLESLEPQTETSETFVRSIPNPNGGTPPNWTWELAPSGGNWGLELIRTPQMWNLNPAVTKGGASTVTGVHDSGFSITHPDLTYLQDLSLLSWSDHGTHVAGTIGASFNNGVGVDGVNPFARLVVNRYGTALGWSFFDFLDSRNDLQVVNISLGNNWYQKTPPINPNTNVAAQFLITYQGHVFMRLQALRTLQGQSLPFVLAAAGNDSGLPLGNIESRWSSPFTYAALVLGAPNILVVEAVQQNAGGMGGATRAPFSNVRHAGALDAAVSAPGGAIMSTLYTTPYGNLSGTSMATPHVTGLVSYLLSLDPHLTHTDLRRLLLENGVAVGGGASNRVDAYASALDIDRLRGTTTILMKLLDVDDGSLDGNQRVACDGCPDFLATDVDGDGGAGDGSIDMSDFRTWRDWLLQIENSPDLTLDGSAIHPKKDVNSNGAVEPQVQENVYPRGDYNGDGILDRTSNRHVAGAINASATDLEVLQRLFNDPNYHGSDLPNLIDSADLEVDGRICLEQPSVVEVRSKLFETSTNALIDERIHTPDEARHIYTVPATADGFTAKLEALDASGKVIGIAQQDFPFQLGSDAFYAPRCGSITLDPEVLHISLNVGETTTETVKLISDALSVNYEVNDTMTHVVVSPDQGAIEADAEELLQMVITCPSQVGDYPQDLGLSFYDDKAIPIAEAVPAVVDMDLRCLAGGVLAAPDPVDLMAETGQTITSELHLQNLGTALDFRASTEGHIRLIGDQSGYLDEEGSAVIPLEATCPEASGLYTGTIFLSFTDKYGHAPHVEAPSAVDVNLECMAAVRILSAIHSVYVLNDAANMASTFGDSLEPYEVTRDQRASILPILVGLGYTRTTVTEIYRDESGTRQTRQTITEEPIDSIGLGTVTLGQYLSGNHNYYYGPNCWLPWPQDPDCTAGVRSATTSSSITASTLYSAENRLAIFEGSIAVNVVDSGFPPHYSFSGAGCGWNSKCGGNHGTVDGKIRTVFELARNTDLVATWSCEGAPPQRTYIVLLRRIYVDSPTTPVLETLFHSYLMDDCTFQETLTAGEFELYVWHWFPYRDFEPYVSVTYNRNSDYRLEFTAIE